MLDVALTLLLLSRASAAAATRYVWQDSSSPAPPYTDWTTAAHVIQDAVDAAQTGDEIVVTNGTYATGGRAVYGSMMNRLAVDKPLSLRSVNGAEFTLIQGRQAPGSIVGNGAIRCVYLTNGAVMSGFTLSDGATRGSGDHDREMSGGGLWCESPTAMVSNCVLKGSHAFRGGGAYGGTLNNCILTSNLVDRGSVVTFGGGAYGSTLNNCLLNGNASGTYGGGAAYCTLNYCTLTENRTRGYGGGAYYGTLNNCTLSANSADSGGGGACFGTLNNCTLTGNSAYFGAGGGASEGTLNNCALIGNSSKGPFCLGGGMAGGTLNNCTLVGNSTDRYGGGAFGSTLNNCILYFNTAEIDGANYQNANLNYCCTTPLPPNGVGNIAWDPMLSSASHLSASSPCRGTGNAVYATGKDIDGDLWDTPPSIGCDEYLAAAMNGPLSLEISTGWTNVAVGYLFGLKALIEGRASASVWEFGDGTAATNQPYSTHAWFAPGVYAVLLRAYNDSNPGGVTSTAAIHVVSAPVHYVAADSPHPLPPYMSWATAAKNIQDAVDFAYGGSEIVVTNGIYNSGGRPVYGGILTNRVAVTKPLTVRSVNGPQFTIIEGYQVPGTNNGDGAIRSVYLTNGASLSGFTLTKGGTRVEGDAEREASGGGLWCESPSSVASNCVLAGNSASYEGGGVFGGTLQACVLTGNSGYRASTPSGNQAKGGGATRSMLNHCTLTANSAGYGGGASGSTLNNSTLTDNSAISGGGGYYCTLHKCNLTENLAGSMGGGTYESTLNDCVLKGNRAFSVNPFPYGDNGYGGGAYGGTLNNCTLVGNFAFISGGGGGACRGTLNNCIVYSNTARNDDNNILEDKIGGVLNYCCTTPMPTNGVGNITNAPLFVDANNWVDLRLQTNSPCINAGNNGYVPGSTDLDGLPRIVSGSVDIGAYEFQGPGSMISYAWLQHYGLLTDGSADATDPDTDGHTTWQEWRCLTDPTNTLSALRLLTASPAGTNVTVSWHSVAGVNYFLERSTGLWASPAFTLLAPNVSGKPGTTVFTDTNAASLTPLFYRVGVGP